MDLFGAILSTYTLQESVGNEALYASLRESTGIPAEAWDEKVAIGRSGQAHSLARRKVRWHQQTLKRMGLIERVPHKRGVWRATLQCRSELTPAPPKVFMVGFSTDLGVAIWGACADVFARLDEPIALAITSPPYCLARPRAYGNPREEDYVDFICDSLDPIVRKLVPGGSICLNISNDIFMKGSPARSLYRERLMLALHDRLGLYKMDELIWENRSKAPGPVAWASKKRVQLSTGWEPVYWLTNDPDRVRSNNQQVLQPHTEQHLKLIASGGERRAGVYGDGANRIKPGSFGGITDGRIPKNILSYGHRCGQQSPARKALASAGLPAHGASMPYKLADFLVRFLSKPGDLVVDPFGGLCTTAQAAQDNARRWVATDIMFEYLWGASHRFEACAGFERDMQIGERS